MFSWGPSLNAQQAKPSSFQGRKQDAGDARLLHLLSKATGRMVPTRETSYVLPTAERTNRATQSLWSPQVPIPAPGTVLVLLGFVWLWPNLFYSPVPPVPFNSQKNTEGNVDFVFIAPSYLGVGIQ